MSAGCAVSASSPHAGVGFSRRRTRPGVRPTYIYAIIKSHEATNETEAARAPVQERLGWLAGKRGATGKEGLGQSHRARPALASRFPVHANVKVCAGLPSLRRTATRRMLIDAMRAGSERFGFRLVHYSIQTNHLHFLVEAKDRQALSRGMQGLLIRIARGLNKAWGRSGKVFRDRYHEEILKAPKRVRNALVYVLQNARKHARGRAVRALDAFASGPWFDGWRKRPSMPVDVPDRPTAAAHSWLLREGWRRHGLLRRAESPARRRLIVLSSLSGQLLLSPSPPPPPPREL